MTSSADGGCHNTCCVCLDSLFSEEHALGVVRPCGHPIHEGCFRSWEASRCSRGSGVSCPTCKQSGAKFLRIYLSMPTVADIESEDDDDDDSIVEDQENDSEKGDDNKNEENDPENDNNDKDDDVVDLTSSPAKKNKSGSSSADTTTKTLKLRVRKYKLQYKQLESKFQECSKKQQEMLERHQSMKQELEETKKEVSETLESYDSNLLELTQKRYETTQLQRDLDDAKIQRKKAEDTLKKMSDAFEKEKSHYAERLHQAKHSRSVETRKIMEDYPKVVEALQQARKKLEEKEKFCASIKARMQQLAPKYKEDLSKIAQDLETSQDSRQQRKRRLEMIKEMSHNNTALDAQKKQREEQRKADITAKKMATPRAFQMVNAAAAQAKKQKAKSNSIDNVLGIWGSSNHDNLQNQQSSLANRGSAISTASAGTFHLSTKTKRKPAVNRNMAGFGKKASLNGGGNAKMDTRTMFRHSSK